LLIVFLLGFISVKLNNKFSLPKINISGRDRRIKIVEKYFLDSKKALYIVEVDSREWLLASSENNLEVISELNEENNSMLNSNSLKKETKTKSFSDYLNLPLIFISLLMLLSIFSDSSFAQSSVTSSQQNFLNNIDLKAPVTLKDLGTPLQLIFFMAFLTLLPFFFIMTTSFIRIIIVLGFLRQAIGTQQVPPNQVIMGIAIFLTIYIMSPVWQEINEKALSPYLDNKISQSVALERGIPPIRNFMLKYTKKEELAFFMKMAKLPQPKNADDVPLHVLIPAYMVSELATGFKIGFFLFLPFLVIDLVVANTLLALGMMMLSPVTISMPFKLLVFTLANGWFLVLQALVTSFRL
jgi:flagellar biosynthetic protein FliP